MKIAFFEIEEWEKEFFKNKLKNHRLYFSKDILNEKNLKIVKDFDIISVFIYSKLDKKILSSLNNLKAIAIRATGYDSIDLKYCKKNKIKVMNVPHYGENTVAEHTFALILSLSRKIPESYERTIRGNFSLDGLRGFDLKGKTIGIVGLGSIGKCVAKISKGFGMKILSYDLKKDLKFSKRFGIKYVSLNYLLKNSDIITFHCPYNKKTHHLLNIYNIKNIKKGSLIINTSRGSVIETKALVKALSRGVVGGVGLDVVEEESLIKEEIQLLSKNFSKIHLKNLIQNHILLTFDNVIITPHNAFNSKEALQRILDVTFRNIKSCFNKRYENLVK